MLYIWLVLSAIFGCADALQHEISSAPRFVVVVPAYNNKPWLRKNLYSIIKQQHPHFRVVYIDDASKDGSGSLIKHYIEYYNVGHKVTLIQNSKRRGQLANIYSVVHSCDPEEVIVIVDGDDSLLHPSVLKKLSEVYRQDGVWLTYGQFLYKSRNKKINTKKGFAHDISEDVIKDKNFRARPWVFTHLRTFKAGLFQNIKLKDLIYQGYFYLAATDLAAMYPMLEMGSGRHAYISEPLYSYNIDNPYKTALALKRTLEKHVRKKKPYATLTDLKQKKYQRADVIVLAHDPLKTKLMNDILSRSAHINKAVVIDKATLVSDADLSHLKRFLQKAQPYIFILTDEVVLNEDDIIQCNKFMFQSRADCCYIKPEVNKLGRDLIPHFYALPKEFSQITASKIVSKELLSTSIKTRGRDEIFTITSDDNAFIYYPNY